MRLIDADALTKNVLKWMPPDPCGREEKEFPFAEDICVSMLMEIEEAPTIEPRPRGRWHIENNSLVVLDVCNKCMRSVRHVAPFYDFCPNCGADMRGGKQDERSD